MGDGQARGWMLPALLLACGVFAATQIGKLPPAIPALRGEFGASLVQMGWLASIFNIVAAVGGLGAGWVADRLGRRVLLKLGMLVLGAGALGGALAPSFALLYPMRVVEGVGFLCIVVAAPTLLREAVEPARLRLALGVWSGYTSLGMAAMLLLAPWLLSVAGWRGGWWVGAAGALLFGALVLAFFPGRGTVVPASAGLGGLLHGLRHAAPWCMAGCFGLYTLQWMALAVWMPTLLVEDEGRTLSAAGALAALMVVVNAPGNVLGGWLSQRRWPILALLAGPAAVMGLAGWAVFGLPMAPELRVALCVAFSLVGGVLPAAVYAAVPAVAARNGNLGAVNGLMVQASNVGTLTGPPLAASLVASGGWHAVAPLFLVGAVLSGALALLASRTLVPELSLGEVLR